MSRLISSIRHKEVLVWLDTRDLQTDHPNKKLDYKQVGPFEIILKHGPMAYKLLKMYKVHPIFPTVKLTKAKDDKWEWLIPWVTLKVWDPTTGKFVQTTERTSIEGIKIHSTKSPGNSILSCIWIKLQHLGINSSGWWKLRGGNVMKWTFTNYYVIIISSLICHKLCHTDVGRLLQKAIATINMSSSVCISL